MGRGSSGAGNKSGGSKGVARTLKLVENMIRGNKTESAVAIDENGNVLFNTSDGHGSSVGITMDQQRKAYGKILTHNHPHGYYFSEEDLNVADVLNLKQLRATTPDGRTFVLERKDGVATNIKALRHDYGLHRFSTAGFATQTVYDPSLSKSEIQHLATLEHTRIMNKWLEKNAPKYGYEFREEKSK